MNIIIKLLILILFIFTYTFADESPTHIHLNKIEADFIKNNPVINVGVETDWPPFDFFENGKYTGFAKDYLDLIEKKSGIKFNLVPDSWNNLVTKIKNKEIDMLPCLAKTAKREKFLLFTESYITTRDYLFTRDDNNEIQTIEDIKDKTVAVVKGYVQEETLKKEHPNVKILYVKNLLDTIDSVITKKADFIVANIALMNYHTKKNSISNLSPRFHFGYNWNRLHMATRDDYDILRGIIQKSLDSISIEEKNPIVSKWIEGKSLNKIKNSKLNLTPSEKEYLKNKKSITVANTLDWIPYDFYENEKAKGYVVDYVKLISNKLGVKPIFISDKWSLLVDEFKKDKIDLLPAVSYRKNREEFVKYTKPYINQTLSIITKKSRTDIINNDDLKDKKVAMMKGWGTTNAFKKQYPDANVIEFESLKDVFDAIRDNFVDATIQNKILSSYYINKNYYSELKIVSDTKLEEFNGKLHMGVGVNNHTLQIIIEKALKSVTEKELKSLDDKWINSSDKINLTKEEKEFISKTVINVAAANNWAPFNFQVEGKSYGLNIEIWNHVLKLTNLKTKFTTNDKYNILVDNLKEKKHDLIISGTKTKDREKFSLFSNSYFKIPVGIATLQDENYIKDASELKNRKIAVGKNFSAHKLMEKHFPDTNFIFVSSAQEGIEYVADGKAFAYVDMVPVLSYTIKHDGFDNVKISGQTGLNYDVRFLIRKDYPLLKTIVDKALNRISVEEKNIIYDKWINTKFEKEPDYSLIWKIVLFFLLVLFFVMYKNRQLIQYQKKLKQANKETENSLINFKKLINLNIAGILIIRDKKIKYINDEALKILEYKSKKEIKDKEISDIFDTKDIDDLCSVLANIKSYEINAISKNDKKIPLLLKGQNIDFDNLPSHIISIVDLTDIKNKEEMMIHQSKMASLGEMIGNIAHQWRQPLSSISTAASGMKLQKEFGQLTDETLYDSLDKITETTQFLSQTIDDFKNYIKDNKIKKEFNLSSAIEKVLSIMKASFVNNFIKVEKNLDDVVINNYENELNQVLLNILSNSKDAIKDIDEKTERYIYIQSYKKNDKVIIEIIDNGGGIDKNIINRIFEPYFTTKHQSQGTGLGLYMTHNILTESIGGDITIENCSFNNYNKCTKVTLTIPLK